MQFALKIAFIGLGNMGGPMAINLLKAKFNVTVFDLMPQAVDTLVEKGASSAATAIDAVKDVDVVISMLPAGKHVEALYLGDDKQQGLISVLPKDCLVIDSSTIDTATAQKVGNALAKESIAFIDAPVSGGVGGATAGTLTFIVGGEKDDFERATLVLDKMGKNIFHAGPLGAGQTAKICNNMLLSVLMVGTSEALQLAIDNGLDPKVVSDIMLQSSGRNWTLELYNPCPNVMPNVPSSNGYEGGFMVDLMKKDLGLAMDTAAKSHSVTPMGELAQRLYTKHSEQGNGKLDFSSIFTLFSNPSKKS
ncbi:MAG: 3-hydroxyisobutyrate dehydrogenase [Paraglaciecola sp.]|uniref:3-hydroxyisobutyrate dehydrogenase n=1 Tax=Paraglaciecola sp. TaxID=1920173 RepID=UPI00273F9D04|nr:3-hydroxyisobutyrate dehydrogenase [Paraglaciecola sp.]MDP5030501.1 3-hydroxyisobutyrate dehydrogenase [Paraglaciecola sp.]MDP5131909.1 3-hydroxyisobutyrate dehydrogenase [Paraglaciecola sp.]